MTTEQTAAWTNATDAMIGGAPMLCGDIAPAVSNSREAEAGARWMLTFIAQWLQGQEQACSPCDAFDFAIHDVEALEEIWPAFRGSARSQPIEAAHVLPVLAEFLVRRLPSLWLKPSPPTWIAPVSRAVALADRIDTLVGMFAAGEAPNGSKDPFALRRAANQIWSMIMLPTVADFTEGRWQLAVSAATRDAKAEAAKKREGKAA